MALKITSFAIENSLLLTATLIDAFLLMILLLLQLRRCTSAAASYFLALIILAVLGFLFLQDQFFLDTTEPGIETLQRP
jgi:hypothetical protein